MIRWLGVGALVIFSLYFALLIMGAYMWIGGVMTSEKKAASSGVSIVSSLTLNNSYVGKIATALESKKYVLLFANNREIRPSGGFIGSLAIIKMDGGVIGDIKFENIYQIDGQMEGHVEPPYPIQEAFGQGWWRLRDANWDVDYASSSAAVMWFLNEGGVKSVDGLVTINFETMRKIVEVIGPITVNSFDEKVSGQNMYSIMQGYSKDTDVYGVSLKRDFLGSFGISLLERVKGLSAFERVRVALILMEELRDGEILFYTKDKNVSGLIGWLGFDGKREGVGLFESNLGSNKANCCIERSVEWIRDKRNYGYNNEIEILFDNKNTANDDWGGNYINYLRVVLPREARDLKVVVGEKELRQSTDQDFEIPNSQRKGMSEDMYHVEDRSMGRIVGFWANINVQQKREIKVMWIDDGRAKKYFKQPGIPEYRLRAIEDGIISKELMINKKEVMVW